MSIVSPCINVCVSDPETDLCYGCSRTTKEIKEWSKYSDQEQLEVIRISRSRMDGWQQKSFDKAYKEKVETCLLYTSPSPRDGLLSRMPSSA